ncbi:MAG: RNA methyltransferase [Acidobacteriota bacterium]
MAQTPAPLKLVVTCALGLEPFVHGELQRLGIDSPSAGRGAVTFTGTWRDVWRANWRLRTANRVLVELGTWSGQDGDALHAGARNLVRRRGKKGALDVGRLMSPAKTLAIKATVSSSKITDERWAALRVKDGLVDGQRDRHGQRSSVDRQDPDLALRLRLHKNEATLLLDTSGDPLDRRGYRVARTDAPVREQLAAACVLAAEWNGEGPIVDPMCGSGTLLIEAASWALGRSPATLRPRFAFERLPGFSADAFERIRDEPSDAPAEDIQLFGVDRSQVAIGAAERNLERAGLNYRAILQQGDAFAFEPPPGPGLLLINPAYGERLRGAPDQWRRLGDLLKQHYAGWTAVVLAGDADRGKHIGLRPRRRYPVRNGPIDARILVFDLY